MRGFVAGLPVPKCRRTWDRVRSRLFGRCRAVRRVRRNGRTFAGPEHRSFRMPPAICDGCFRRSCCDDAPPLYVVPLFASHPGGLSVRLPGCRFLRLVRRMLRLCPTAERSASCTLLDGLWFGAGCRRPARPFTGRAVRSGGLRHLLIVCGPLFCPGGRFRRSPALAPSDIRLRCRRGPVRRYPPRLSDRLHASGGPDAPMPSDRSEAAGLKLKRGISRVLLC